MPINQVEDDFVSNDTSNNRAMHWTIEYIEDRHFARVVAKGIYNIDDHMLMLEDVAARDFWKPGMNLLIDASELDFSRTNLEQLREASIKRIELDDLIGDGKTAVLVNSLVNFGRARQFQLITSGKISAKMDVFKDEDKALEWLLA